MWLHFEKWLSIKFVFWYALHFVIPNWFIQDHEGSIDFHFCYHANFNKLLNYFVPWKLQFLLVAYYNQHNVNMQSNFAAIPVDTVILEQPIYTIQHF